MSIYVRGTKSYPVRFRACHVGCAQAFKADRAAGVIYPPFKKPWGGGFFQNQEEASMEMRFCAYCSADVRTAQRNSLDALRARAARATHFRGHRMQWRVIEPLHTMQGRCSQCEMLVLLRVRPQLNEVDIGGEAVALNCAGRPATGASGFVRG